MAFRVSKTPSFADSPDTRSNAKAINYIWRSGHAHTLHTSTVRQTATLELLADPLKRRGDDRGKRESTLHC
jgi:hypothetical protein